jgi:hypothetical protein
VRRVADEQANGFAYLIHFIILDNFGYICMTTKLLFPACGKELFNVFSE